MSTLGLNSYRTHTSQSFWMAKTTLKHHMFLILWRPKEFVVWLGIENLMIPSNYATKQITYSHTEEEH